MIICRNSVVEFHYALSEAGHPLENSHSSEPLVYIHGHKGVLAGLEDAIEGKQAGNKFEVTLLPEHAYGERRAGAEQRIPIKHLQGAKVWKAGMTAVVESNQGKQQVTIIKVGRFNADCDLNHPFAGKTLTFAVEIVAVREATDDEINHGHVHAAGGCGH